MFASICQYCTVHPAMLSAFRPSTKDDQKHQGALFSSLFACTWVSDPQRSGWKDHSEAVFSGRIRPVQLSSLGSHQHWPSKVPVVKVLWDHHLKWIRNFPNNIEMAKEMNIGDLALLESVKQVIRWSFNFSGALVTFSQIYSSFQFSNILTDDLFPTVKCLTT